MDRMVPPEMGPREGEKRKLKGLVPGAELSLGTRYENVSLLLTTEPEERRNWR